MDNSTITANKAATVAAHSLPRTDITGNLETPLAGPYILIIDDDPKILDLLTDLLESEGWRVIGMRSAMAAWTFLKNVRLLPSLILLDVMMPSMDGREFMIYQHADAELKRIAVVMISAGVKLEQLPEKLNIVAFLPKPFDFPRLFDLCATYCPRMLRR